jgi:hypothetical protein
MLFTSAENLAGLERAVVIVTGFHLYEHLESRSKLQYNTRVDSRVFIAVSRCTYKAIFVEVDASTKFAKHFEIFVWADKIFSFPQKMKCVLFTYLHA